MEGAAKKVARGPMAMEDLLERVCGPAATIYKTGVNMYNSLKVMKDAEKPPSPEAQSQQLGKIPLVGSSSSSPANFQLGSKEIDTSSQVFRQVQYRTYVDTYRTYHTFMLGRLFLSKLNRCIAGIIR